MFLTALHILFNVPAVSRDKDFLVDFRFDQKLMHCAVYATVVLCAWVFVSIVEDEEVGLISIGNIKVNVGVFQKLMVLPDGDEKFSVVALHVLGL